MSRFKRGNDFWRFADAKLANFDTVCGYDTQFLLSAGLKAALAIFSHGETAKKEDIREYLFDENGDCWFTKEDLSEWESHLTIAFPGNMEDEDNRVWIDRAIQFQCPDEGLAFLDQLEKEGSGESLSYLKYVRRALGDVEGAITCQLRILNEASDLWEQLSATQSLADLYVENEQPTEAWNVIEQTEADLDQIDGWHRVGLGRALVKTAFDIANASFHPNARKAFNWACHRGAMLERTTMQILRAAIQAAERFGDEERKQVFVSAATEEQKRIDELLSR